MQPFAESLKLEGNIVSMEIDTGASITLIGEQIFKIILPHCSAKPSHLKLKIVTGEIVQPNGSVNVEVEYQKQKQILPLTVVPGKTQSLLGRNWLQKVKLDWQKLFSLSDCQNINLQNILNKHKAVFNDELGLLKNFEVSILIETNVTPKFCNARAVPYALKEKIDKELNRFVNEGMFEHVTNSKWATPMVPVLKSDGTLRICGDYKQTINQVAQCDNYLIPSTDDLLASVAGGERFTKFDLSQIY